MSIETIADPTFCYWGFPIGLAAQISRHPSVAQWVHRKRPIMACSRNDSVLFPCNHYLPHVVQYGHDSKCPLLELRVMSLLILVCKKYIQPTFRSLPDTFKYFMSHIIAKTWPSALNSPIIGEHRGERKISFV